MTHRDEERPVLDRDEQAFVERLAASWAPPPTTPAQRAAFDEALRERLERRRRPWLVIPVLATAAAAAVIGFALMPSVGPTAPRGEESAVAGAWDAELFLSSDVSPSLDRDGSEGLPDDYEAIASLILGG
jgi:ferric-dicitrate binding protein FerR (iron transport regulator)